MQYALVLGGLFCAVATAFHLVSAVAVGWRFRRRNIRQVREPESVTILRPVCGLENFVEQTLRSTFRLDYPRYEILFCVADNNDPVIPVVQRLIAENPGVRAKLLSGASKFSDNPKLNNLAKGWHQASHEWVLMVDSNVFMPRDHLQRMFAAWRGDTGLVCSPPVGAAPDGPWAELECAFLNTYQARWQCFADTLGFGFAQGKAMLWRRSMLDAAGGIEALGREPAEDAAATKIVRDLGLRVRLVDAPFTQPLGRRSLGDVWRRQVRWGKLRRSTFKLFFLPEIFVGIVPPLTALLIVASALDWPIGATAIPFVVAWYGAEACLAIRAGWHYSLLSVPMSMLRDVLSPALWVAAWVGNDFEWRGNAMNVQRQCLLPANE